MSFTLRISFTGICAFVPKAPYAPAEKKNAMLVLIPDGRKKKQKCLAKLQVHVPELIYPDYKDEGTLRVLSLIREDIRIETGNGNSQTLQILDAIESVPDMNKILDGKARINPECLKGDSKNLLAARFQLTEGTLQVSNTNENLWTFHAGHAAVKIATHIVQEIEVPGPEAKIVCKHLGTNNESRPEVIIRPSNGSNTVNILVKNIGPQDRPPTAVSTSEESFRWMFLITDKFSNAKHCNRIPKLENSNPSGLEINDTFCPGGRFPEELNATI